MKVKSSLKEMEQCKDVEYQNAFDYYSTNPLGVHVKVCSPGVSTPRYPNKHMRFYFSSYRHSIYQIRIGYCSIGLHNFSCVDLLATDLKLDPSMWQPHPDIKSHKEMIPGASTYA